MASQRSIRSSSMKLLCGILAVMLAVALMPSQAAYADEAASRAYAGFPDVQPTDWYVTSGDLDYAIECGLLSGYGNGLFGPYDTVTRAQAVTVLWRIAGEPSAETGHYLDADYSQWYGTALSWAHLTGVASGYGDSNTFGPNDPVTREQLCVMLSNFADKIGGRDVSSNCAALDGIAGAGQVSGWAREAVGWAVDEGIISGELHDGTAYVNPAGDAQRCAFAKMAGTLHGDVLDGGKNLAADGGIWHYEDNFIRMDMPLAWKEYVAMSNRGSMDGTMSTNIALKSDPQFFLFRIWYVPGVPGWQEVSHHELFEIQTPDGVLAAGAGTLRFYVK